MTELHPAIEPYAHGFLAVGDGQQIYWEVCGNPVGKPAVVVHGGPGSGCSPRFRRLFDPAVYRIVLFDQRNCGRSRPHASEYATDLSTNTTAHLIADIEQLRVSLGIDRWLVLGGSWGSTLALAYAEQHPQHVTEMILFGVTTGRHSEFDWLFRGGVALFFPGQWDALRLALPADERDGDIIAAYSRRLNDPDPLVRQRATLDWCLWESATPAWPPTTGLAEMFNDAPFAAAFARIVVHYVQHYAWLEDGVLMRNADVLSAIPGILVNGRFDFQAPIGNAWELRRVWPHAELLIVDEAGHSSGIFPAVVQATERFASAH
ncbi:MAG: prolyl aminopeptidase [Ktedonobacterales bacterium]|nr:prolyl aminopeptidase [Ktedonobacterales bacterium]